MKHATYDQVVPREMYVRVVKRIKCKYNTEWLEKWKTRTDTTKHVYEDINTGLSKLFPSKLVFGKHNVFVLCSRWKETRQGSHRSLHHSDTSLL